MKKKKKKVVDFDATNLIKEVNETGREPMDSEGGKSAYSKNSKFNMGCILNLRVEMPDLVTRHLYLSDIWFDVTSKTRV